MPRTEREKLVITDHKGSRRSIRREPSRRGLALAVLAGFFLGLLVQPAARAVARTATYEKLGVFTRVLTYVQNNYVEEVQPTDLIYGAIQGMLSTLDAHSAFMTPEEYEEMKIDTGGEFGGIGLEVSIEDDHLTVVTPLDGTPAFHAGLRPGDVIVAINGEETANMGIADAVRMMRGAPGTTVVLTVDRPGFLEPRDIPVEREQIRLNPVSARMVEGFAVIRVKSFQERTDRYVQRSLRRLKEESGGELRGLVLDLRNNPGGLLDQAVSVADTWLSGGVIVTTRGRGAHAEVQRAHRRGTEPAYPIVVLINEGSASASEIVAGALQDHRRAVLIGASTFGKGSVQTVIDLDDGSGLKLTVARYYTPKGNAIGEGGIRPDVFVEAEPMKRSGSSDDAQPPGEEPAREEEEGSDPQLKAAIDALRTWYIFKSTERENETRSTARP